MKKLLTIISLTALLIAPLASAGTGDVTARIDNADLSATHVRLDGSSIASTGDTAALHALYTASLPGFTGNVPNVAGLVLIAEPANVTGSTQPAQIPHTLALGDQRLPLGNSHAGDSSGDSIYKSGPPTVPGKAGPSIVVVYWVAK